MQTKMQTEYSDVLGSTLWFHRDKAIAVVTKNGKFARLYDSKFSSRLLAMIGTHNGVKMKTAFIKYMASHEDASDDEVLRMLADTCTGCSSVAMDERGDNRAKQIKQLIGDVPPDSYLDFGGNLWYNAAAIGDAIGATSIEIVDLMDPRADMPPGIKYHKIIPGVTAEKLPFSTASIGLVTILMVLHHIENPRPTLTELHRILKPGGIVVVREHDTIPGLNDLLDLLHMMHGIVWKSETDFEMSETYYRSFDGWIAEFRACGFTLQKKSVYVNSDVNIYNTGYLIFTKG